MHRRAGLVVVTDGPATPGRTVALRPRTGPAAWLRIAAPCEVTEVIDRPDARGFTYRALPGHPERGTESFLLVRDPETAVVRLHIEAESEHATLLARLGAPLARAEQNRLTRRYLAALAESHRGGQRMTPPQPGIRPRPARGTRLGHRPATDPRDPADPPGRTLRPSRHPRRSSP